MPSNVQIVDDELHLPIDNSNANAPKTDGSPVWCMAEGVLISNPLNAYGQITLDIKCYGNSLVSWKPDNNAGYGWITASTNFVALTDKNVVMSIFSYNSRSDKEIVLFEIGADNKWKFNDVTQDFVIDYTDLEKITLEIDWTPDEIVYTTKNGKGDIIGGPVLFEDNMPEPSENTKLHFRLYCGKGGCPTDERPKHISISNVIIVSEIIVFDM